MSDRKPVALVTGASRGIGAGIALKLGKDGYHVAVNYASSEALAQKVLEQIMGAGGSGELCRFDVSNSVQVSENIDKLAKTRGGIDCLVNNAGLAIDSLLVRLRDSDLDKTLDVDLKGAIYCTREAAKFMMRARSGSIIQISSVIGQMGNAGQTAYSAAKAGLIGFTKATAKELASRGVRVNAVAPGFIETDMTGALTETQKEAILRQIPLGYIGSVDDVANAVSFLAGPQSRYITGQVLCVNGGLYV